MDVVKCVTQCEWIDFGLGNDIMILSIIEKRF
jgi:hypothetical protein